MVRNTQGGSKTKSQARKSSGPVAPSSSRTPRGEFERLGVVSKMLGNGMCYVSVSGAGFGEADTLCMIRGKFRGRNKKHNFLGIGTEVIVGLREWEAPAFKTVDLLEVLGTSAAAYSAASASVAKDDVVFSEDADMDFEVPAQRIPSSLVEDTEQDLNFEDI